MRCASGGAACAAVPPKAISAATSAMRGVPMPIFPSPMLALACLCGHTSSCLESYSILFGAEAKREGCYEWSRAVQGQAGPDLPVVHRSEEHTSELPVTNAHLV